MPAGSQVTEGLTLELQSQADLANRDRLEAIGAALDADPRLRPDRAGPRDPPRTPISSVADHLVAWDPPQKRGHRDDQFFSKASPPGATGILSLAHVPWPRKLRLTYDVARLGEDDSFEAIAALLRRLADAMDAYYGFSALNDVLRQEVALRTAAPRSSVTKPVGSAPYFIGERAIPGVYWLNYFGPATIEKWNDRSVKELGVRQEATADGGRLIWATESPEVLDSSVTSVTGYAWKRPFYDAIGLDTFIHDGWQDPGPGVRVPTFEEHRLATRPQKPE